MPVITKTEETINLLKEEVEKKGFVDIGPGVEKNFNMSDRQFLRVQQALVKDGLVVYSERSHQKGSNNWTFVKVLCKSGTTLEQAMKMLGASN